jgi:F-type H+-transporting ATPase subunit delta
MSNDNSSAIARPYAKAVFELAFEARALAKWSNLLAVGAAVAEDAAFARLLNSPHVTAAQLGDIVVDVVGQTLSKDGGGLDEQGKNLLRVIAENRRLGVLPQISAEYELMRAQAENTVDVSVTSAAALDESQLRTYADALKKRLKREVRLHPAVDASLLGGAILRANDLVIDGSLRGQLDRLRTELTS